MDTAHILLIVVHATAAALSFITGLIIFLRLPAPGAKGWFNTYATCIWVAVIALTAVVIVDWPRLDIPRRIAYPILVALGIYLLWRTERARRALRIRTDGWVKAFLGHIGFVLISLFDGFCIVLAIDLHSPVWVVIAAAVFGVVVGVLAIRARTNRETELESKETPS